MEAYVQMPLETYDALKHNNEYLKGALKKERESHDEYVAQSKKEMFEALGYEEQFKGSDIYRNKKDGSRIAFDNYEGGTIDVVELSYIPRELLKAINMRCQELGWM